MKRQTLTVILMVLATALEANAGTLADGKWTPANCGTRPEVPQIDSKNVEAYNRSVGQLNEWQKKAQAYNDCVVQEANADNTAIANAANAEQEKFRSDVNKINAASEAARKKLE